MQAFFRLPSVSEEYESVIYSPRRPTYLLATLQLSQDIHYVLNVGLQLVAGVVQALPLVSS